MTSFHHPKANWWLATKRVERYKSVIEILGIDLSSVFNTIRRKKLLSVLHSFFDTDNVHIIRLLLSATKTTVRVDDALSAPFNIKVGTTQRDSLSPVLFVVYLEAALRTLCGCFLHQPPADHNLPEADNTDFISTDQLPKEKCSTDSMSVPIQQIFCAADGVCGVDVINC